MEPRQQTWHLSLPPSYFPDSFVFAMPFCPCEKPQARSVSPPLLAFIKDIEISFMAGAEQGWQDLGSCVLVWAGAGTGAFQFLTQGCFGLVPQSRYQALWHPCWGQQCKNHLQSGCISLPRWETAECSVLLSPQGSLDSFHCGIQISYILLAPMLWRGFLTWTGLCFS